MLVFFAHKQTPWSRFSGLVRRFVYLVMLCAAPLALAQNDLQSWLGTGDAEDTLLEADQAFRVAFDEQAQTLSFEVAPKYYLYVDKLEFLHDGQPLAATRPEGQQKDDPTFGQVPVMYSGFEVPVDLAGLKAGDTLTVNFQGCADIGVCYPPMSKQWVLSQTPANEFKDAALAPNAAPPAPVNEQDSFTELLSNGGFIKIIVVFFVAGLGLALTPCVLPMVPILASIIRGSEQRDGAAQGAKHSAFSLSLVYVLAMASTFAVLGVLVGLGGSSVQAQLQSPTVIWLVAILFVLLAASMFGFYHLAPPAALSAKLQALSARQKGGSYAGVALMGVLSALVVGPCVTAPLIGALVYISQSQDALLGGLALFAMGLGMGVPLLLVGLGAGRWLPKTGAWMSQVNICFGFMLLGLALWMLSRLYGEPIIASLARPLLAAFLLYITFSLLFDKRSDQSRVLASFAAALALAAFSGFAPGSGGGASSSAPRDQIVFERFESPAKLQQAIDGANQPVLLDLYATWCVSCKELEHGAFADAAVINYTKSGTVRAFQLDLTAFNEAHQSYLKAHGLYGPPTLMFFDDQGNERLDLRAVGVVTGDQLAERLALIAAR